MSKVPEIIKETIEDDDGQKHTYEITRHAGSAGYNLAREILPAIGSFFVYDDKGEAGIDVTKALSSIPEVLDHAMVLNLLSNTRRNGIRITPVVFDEVYAGNYGEFVFALKAVLMANFGPSIKRLTSGKGNLLEGL